ncbi:MAG: AbrB/MazE/SpoVT family DNA-binding domain-containing protein [Methanotrichaceae archaeon]
MLKSIELDATVKVRLHGRVTLPQDLREALGIKDGDIVHIKVSKVVPETGASSSENSHEPPTAA